MRVSCGLVLFASIPAVAAPPSASRLSIHLIRSYTTGSAQIIGAHPRVIKILDTNGSMLAAARAYKAGTPGGLVVLRVYTQKRYTLQDDPADSAVDFWNTVLAPPLNALSPADRTLIDYVEGPNECESTPCWGSVQEAQWYGSFWQGLARYIAAAGFRPCAFSIPVGNPPGDLSTVHQLLSAIAPALRTCKELGGAWSYHAYTHYYTTDLATELWYSLRYRRFYGYFAQAHPDLLDMPLILTEGGMDSGGNPQTSGWAANGDAAKYQNWLAWFDDRLREDPYIIGCTLFQIGDVPGWPSFDLEPIAPWMSSRLTSLVAPVIECSPAGLTSSVIRGSNAAAQTFTVRTTAGGSTLAYTITDNAGWLQVMPAAGTSTGESDAITVIYSTSGLSTGAYDATITVSDHRALNSPLTIDVRLTVEPESPVPGDLDGDGDVDEVDFDAFRGCLTGPGQGPPTAGCDRSDLDRDHDVDQEDYGYLQRCMSGAGIPAQPGCAGPGIGG